jgi:hypothetical protein
MLLSRFWYLVLAAAAIMGITAALLGRGIINRQHLDHIDDGLRRDRFAIESILKLDARARLDTLAPLAADGTIREAVRTRGKSKVEGQDGGKALKERLRTLNQQLEELRADLLIALDANGEILGQEGRKPAREGAGLGEVPLVASALSGFIGDDVWVYDGAVYRMAARPIIDRGQVVGALLHGQRLDAVLAQRLSERIGGASIAFFFRDRVIASYTPTDVPGAPTQADMTAPLANVLNDTQVQKGDRSDAIDLDGRGRAVYSLVAGSASSLGVGYALSRPYSVIASPWAVFNETKKEDVEALPQFALGSALVLLFLLAMATVYWERDRPLTKLREGLDKLAAGRADELDLTVLSGVYRKVGERVNRALDVVVEKSGGKRREQQANLDEILGPTPESLTSAAFSFGSEDAPVEVSQPKPMPAPGSAAMPMPMPAPSVGSKANSLPGRVPPPPLKVPAPPPPRMPSSKGSSSSAAVAESPALSVAEGSSLRRIGEENGQLTVLPDPAGVDSEAHFQEVYEQYVTVKQQCGESTADLTYEKLAVTLRKNRDQILSQRPDTREVRFTVYVKAGKAALKATPVKV